MILTPNSGELAYIANRLGLDEKEATQHRKFLVKVWTAGVMSALGSGLRPAIEREIAALKVPSVKHRAAP